MHKKLLTIIVIVSIFSLAACTEDPTMNEVTEGVELDQPGDPDDDEDKDPES